MGRRWRGSGRFGGGGVSGGTGEGGRRTKLAGARRVDCSEEGVAAPEWRRGAAEGLVADRARARVGLGASLVVRVRVCAFLRTLRAGWPTVAGIGDVGQASERHSSLASASKRQGRSSSRAQGGGRPEQAGGNPGSGGWPHGLLRARPPLAMPGRCSSEESAAAARSPRHDHRPAVPPVAAAAGATVTAAAPPSKPPVLEKVGVTPGLLAACCRGWSSGPAWPWPRRAAPG